MPLPPLYYAAMPPCLRRYDDATPFCFDAYLRFLMPQRRHFYFTISFDYTIAITRHIDDAAADAAMPPCLFF